MGKSALKWRLLPSIHESYFLANRFPCGSYHTENFNHSEEQLRLTAVAALRECRSSKDLGTGKLVHTRAIQCGLDYNIYVANSLITMYGRCGRIPEAQRVFEQIPCPSIVSWNSLILGLAENAREQEALLLAFCGEFTPDDRTYVAALKACSSLALKEEGELVAGELVKLKSLENGFALHKKVLKAGAADKLFVGNTLVDMYSNCGSLRDATLAFSRMKVHSVVSWTALIMGFAENGDPELALEIFELMKRGGVEPNGVTFLALFKACASVLARNNAQQAEVFLLKGMEIHAEAENLKLVESEEFVASALVDMYSKFGRMTDAWRVFERSSCRSVASWNALISGFVENGQCEAALGLFSNMVMSGIPVPDSRTYVAALRACSAMAAREPDEKTNWLETGRRIHVQAARDGSDLELFVASSLVDMYSKCGFVDDARKAFDKVLQRDVVLWTSLLLGYVENHQEEVALELFSKMDCRPNSRTLAVVLKACSSLASSTENSEEKSRWINAGLDVESRVSAGMNSDLILSSALVDLYSKCGMPGEAHRVFDRMKTHQDVVCWTSLMSGYTETGSPELALELFTRMQQRAQPDAPAFAVALKSCGALAALESGKRVHSEICRVGLENELVVIISLLDFYGRTGSPDESQQVFDSSSGRIREPSVWNALIAAHSRWGNSEKVYELFHAMQEAGLKPTGVTFVCVLAACSHAGLVERALGVFKAMEVRYGVRREVEHYVCIVDVLGRKNLLEKALLVVESMPFASNAMIWRTLLGACWKWKNVEVGRVAFESLLRVDGGQEDSEVGFKLMDNIHACAAQASKKNQNV